MYTKTDSYLMAIHIPCIKPYLCYSFLQNFQDKQQLIIDYTKLNISQKYKYIFDYLRIMYILSSLVWWLNAVVFTL